MNKYTKYAESRKVGGNDITWDEITDSCEYIDEAYDELGNMWSLYKDTEKGVYLISPYSGKLKDVNIEKE